MYEKGKYMALIKRIFGVFYNAPIEIFFKHGFLIFKQNWEQIWKKGTRLIVACPFWWSAVRLLLHWLFLRELDDETHHFYGQEFNQIWRECVLDLLMVSFLVDTPEFADFFADLGSPRLDFPQITFFHAMEDDDHEGDIRRGLSLVEEHRHGVDSRIRRFDCPLCGGRAE